MNTYLSTIKKSLLTGVSYAIPFVASGGILIAVAIAFVPMTSTRPDFSHAPIWMAIL
jgi:fructose-specific phosphotransferase system IIC component